MGCGELRIGSGRLLDGRDEVAQAIGVGVAMGRHGMGSGLRRRLCWRQLRKLSQVRPWVIQEDL